MRILFMITYYKLKIMLSDRVFFLSMIILPLIIMLATGYALRYEKLNVIPVSVVDEDNSEYSNTLFKRFSTKEGFDTKLQSREKAREYLKDNKVEIVFIIKSGFQQSIKMGQTSELIEYLKSPASVSSNFVSEVFAGEVIRFITNDFAINTLKSEFKESQKVFDEKKEEEVLNYLDSLWTPKPLLSTSYKEIDGNSIKEINRPSLPSATATSSGIIVVFIMFFILFSSGWLIEERVNGTLKRLVSIHNGLGYTFGSNVLSLFLCGTFQIILFKTIIKIAFGIELFTSIWAYVVFECYILSVIGLSLLFSALLKTPAQLQATAPLFALITSFIGGCFWNFVDVPSNMKLLSKFTLQGWALDGINHTLIDSTKITSFVSSVYILVGFSIISIPLSFLLVRRK